VGGWFHFPLLRTRQVTRPTVWGWLLIAVVVTAIALLGARHAYGLLAPNDPAPGARLLVVEGWLDPTDLDQAVIAFRAGHYERVVTTGGPIAGHRDERDRKCLRSGPRL